MDFRESTKVVYERIENIDPENVIRIFGYLLLQNHDDREMLRLAFSPDNVIQQLINKAKTELGLSSKPAVSVSVSNTISPPQGNPSPVSDFPLQMTPFSPAASARPFPSPRPGNSPWDPQVNGGQHQVHKLGDFVPRGYSGSLPDDFPFQSQIQFLAIDDSPLENSIGSDFSGGYYYAEQQPSAAARTSRRSPSMPEFPLKVCHYFTKGFCKHGSSCRYFHGHQMQESFSQIFGSGTNELANDDFLLPGSLEKIEFELTELLKSRRGCPVSIASLPMLYYEKYGRTLQAEGYLTESQRHGKAGFSLTKLLARLKNSIRLIDRPHGQHSVILAEDLPKYMEVNGERSDQSVVSSSKQIYLTFPAESTFTEQDVSNYFSKFGPVQDVRIPCQHKRMFGFVTFVFVETVNQILGKGSPHYICGARVLVKPYREKASSRNVDRRQHPIYYSPHFIDGDSELQPIPRVCDNSRLLRKQQLMEEHEQALELERRRFSELQLTAKTAHPYFAYSMDEFKQHSDAVHAEQADFLSAERLNYLLEVLNNGSTSEDRSSSTNYNEQESSSQGLNLPESPFASPIRNSISTVT